MFTKANILSLAHTFIATFITAFAAIIVAIPTDSFFSPQTWTGAAIAGILISAVRSGVKSISGTFLRQS
jgi:hypothetical protein